MPPRKSTKKDKNEVYGYIDINKAVEEWEKEMNKLRKKIRRL